MKEVEVGINQWKKLETRSNHLDSQLPASSYSNSRICQVFYLKTYNPYHLVIFSTRILSRRLIDLTSITFFLSPFIALPAALSPIFYLSLESGFLTLDNEEDESGIPGKETINFSGSTPDMGEFNLRIQEADSNEYNRDGKHYDDFRDTVGRTSFLGAQIPPGSGWQAKSEWKGTGAGELDEDDGTDQEHFHLLAFIQRFYKANFRLQLDLSLKSIKQTIYLLLLTFFNYQTRWPLLQTSLPSRNPSLVTSLSTFSTKPIPLLVDQSYHLLV